MSAPICHDCKRPKANAADWAAFEQIEECAALECPWGADRCWEMYGCGWIDLRTSEIVTQAKALRAGRPLSQVPHECPPSAQALRGKARGLVGAL